MSKDRTALFNARPTWPADVGRSYKTEAVP